MGGGGGGGCKGHGRRVQRQHQFLADPEPVGVHQPVDSLERLHVQTIRPGDAGQCLTRLHHVHDPEARGPLPTGLRGDGEHLSHVQNGGIAHPILELDRGHRHAVARR